MRPSDGGSPRRVVAIVGQGFEEVELAMYTDPAGGTALVEGVPKPNLSIASLQNPVRPKHGLRFGRDLDLESASVREWDAVYVPGGRPESGNEEIDRPDVAKSLSVDDDRILSDIGRVVGLDVLAFSRSLIGEQAAASTERELKGATTTAAASVPMAADASSCGTGIAS